ncbi:MAG: hypothetical protein R2843_01990 [Thermomicrobiales bacterium]
MSIGNRKSRTKLELLERDTSLRRVIVDDDLPGLTDALWRVGDLLAADEPTLWHSSDGVELPRLGLRLLTPTHGDRANPIVDASNATPLGAKIGARLERQHGVERLFDALGLACQEDLVIAARRSRRHRYRRGPARLLSEWLGPRDKVPALPAFTDRWPKTKSWSDRRRI